MSATIAYVEAPSTPPDPGDGVIWTGLPMSWTGWNGDHFSLTDRAQGITMKPGVRGLHMPAHQRHASESPALAGSRHRGSRTLDREVFWPIRLFKNTGSVDWMLFDRRFWDTMDPDQPGTWTVTHPDGRTRTLQCRFSESDDVMDRNPLRLGWSTYGVSLLADQPYWSGEPFSRQWEVAPPKDFHGDGTDYLYYVSSSAALASARMTNEGNLPAYPVWLVVGPTSTVTVGVEGKTITIPFTIPAGKAVEIDTNPVTGQICWFGDWVPVVGTVGGFELINRIDRTPELGPAAFSPIPAGDGKQLSLSMTGTGIVRATITPLYRRAW